MDSHYDLIIVGAGPSGCRAAEIICQLKPKWRVLLIESSENWSKYHTICTGGISTKAMEELGPDAAKHIVHKLKKVEERWPSNIISESAIDGYIIDRLALMEEQLEKFQRSGGEILRDTVVDLRDSFDGCRVLTKGNRIPTSKYLIGADGVNSIVRKRIFGTESERVVPVSQYHSTNGGKPGTLIIEYGAQYKGKYRGIFPTKDGYVIGFPTGTKTSSDSNARLNERLIPVGLVSTIVKGNVAIIGDAAGMANPITFAGLHNSWASARLVVNAIVDDDLPRFEKDWRESPLADPTFLDAHRLLRSIDDETLENLASIFRCSSNLSLIIMGFMNTPGFSTFYRAHLRKLSYGW